MNVLASSRGRLRPLAGPGGRLAPSASPADRLQWRLLQLGTLVTAVLVILSQLDAAGLGQGFDDAQLVLAPAIASGAIALAVGQGGIEHRHLRLAIAAALGVAAAGQLLSVLPASFPTGAGALESLADLCYAGSGVAGMGAVLVALHRRIETDARPAVLLDGLVITLASMTLTFGILLGDGAAIAPAGAGVPVDLELGLLSLFAVSFFASAAAAIVAVLALGVAPAPRGVWAVIGGMLLVGVAWVGWLLALAVGGPQGGAVDYAFGAGSLLLAYGAMTWSLERGGGDLYHRLALATSEWLPMLAIAGCALLDIAPREQPGPLDPIDVGTGLVIFVALARQRLTRQRERAAAERLTREIEERASTSVSLARIEPAATVEETAGRICAVTLELAQIDAATVFGCWPDGEVVPIAHAGVGGLETGQALDPEAGAALRARSADGPWLETWLGPDAVGLADLGSSRRAAGIRNEAFLPLVWNDRLAGLLAVATLSPDHAARLPERLSTFTELAMMSAAVLGPGLQERWQRDALSRELEATIGRRAFRPVFQPIVDLGSLRPVGFEALVRFDDGARPDLRFLEADRVGMMVRLETACLRAQVDQAQALPPGAWLSLNVSPALLTAIVPLPAVLEGVDRDVVLEVTEHAEVPSYPALLDAIGLVRGRARLAVDDAGAGYAGLRHIVELRPQFVKLDISLVRSIDTDRARQAMVTGMAQFSAGVGCQLIAEGIETEGELETLRRLGVPLGQGFLLGRPAPVGAWSGPAGRRAPGASRRALGLRPSAGLSSP